MYYEMHSIDETQWHTHVDLVLYLSMALNEWPKKIEDSREDWVYQKSLLGS